MDWAILTEIVCEVKGEMVIWVKVEVRKLGLESLHVVAYETKIDYGVLM